MYSVYSALCSNGSRHVNDIIYMFSLFRYRQGSLFRYRQGPWNLYFDLEIHPCLGTACLTLQSKPLAAEFPGISYPKRGKWHSHSLSPENLASTLVNLQMAQRELETLSVGLDAFVRLIFTLSRNQLSSWRKQWPCWWRPGDVTGRRLDVCNLRKALESGESCSTLR